MLHVRDKSANFRFGQASPKGVHVAATVQDDFFEGIEPDAIDAGGIKLLRYRKIFADEFFVEESVYPMAFSAACIPDEFC